MWIMLYEVFYNLILTYYVVAQMGLNFTFFIMCYFETDYMLEHTLSALCLLFIYTFYLFKLDVSRNIFLLKSENDINALENSISVQSAENRTLRGKGFSETARQLPEDGLDKFWPWFAGVIDGDGNFDIRYNNLRTKKVLKQIRIKLHNRDIRILNRIQNLLHIGRIIKDKNNPYCTYIVSDKISMMFLIRKLNGNIRLKVPGFKEACFLYNIDYIKANYILKENDPYFSGLIDSDGSIVFNYAGNRIECNLELEYNEYSSRLNLDHLIPGCKPTILFRKKASTKKGPKIYNSIAIRYQNVKSMLYVYNYFMINRLYCNIKFYRISKIKPFLEIRKYKNFTKGSVEQKKYSHFLIDWIKYENQSWEKVPFVNKIT